MSNWLERTELLLGKDKLQTLMQSSVLIVGAGGVGASAAEMICRAGVGRLTIVDSDYIAPSNINRQLIALHSTIEKSKTQALSERLLDINPALNLTTIQQYITSENVEELLNSQKFDYVVDAIDTLSPKTALVVESLKKELRVVSSMGAGAKTDPTLVEIADISKTKYCPLAHMLRKKLNKRGYRKGFYAVFSTEEVREGAMILCKEDNKKSNVGTISYMPTIFGCAVASVVIRELLGENIKNEKRG